MIEQLGILVGVVVLVGEDGELVLVPRHGLLLDEDQKSGGAGIGGVGTHAGEVTAKLGRVPEDAGGGVEQGLVGGLRSPGDENGAGVTAPEEGDHVGQDLVEVGFAAILDVAGEGLADDRVGLKNVPAHGLEGIGLGGGPCGG